MPNNAGLKQQPRKRIMRSFKIHEISGVDIPAQEGAVALIMKRVEPPKIDSQTEKIEKIAALTSEFEGHTHLIHLDSRIHIGENEHKEIERTSGITTFQDDHGHPWVRTNDGLFIIGATKDSTGKSHTHTIEVVSKPEENEEDLFKQEMIDSKTKENTMPTAKKDDEATVETLKAELARINAVVALTDIEKAYYNGLEGEADQSEFLSKSSDDKGKLLEEKAKAIKEAEETKKAKEKVKAEKAKEADPVMYTTTDGLDLRKSAGKALITMAKANDAIRKENQDLRNAREQDALEKRATDELKYLPGDLPTRMAMLKALDSIEDNTQRAAALTALKAQNEALEGAFKSVGASNSPAPGSPADALDTLAKAYQDKHPESSIEQAMSEVLKTDKGGELYGKSVN